MNRKVGRNVLVDTGYWFALFNPRDQHHEQARECAELIEDHTLIVPWPTLYETLRTKFLKFPTAVQTQFERLLAPPNAEFLSDEPYRDAALKATLDPVGRRYSMVDNVLRLVLDDANVRVDYFVSFNWDDFYDICGDRLLTQPRWPK